MAVEERDNAGARDDGSDRETAVKDCGGGGGNGGKDEVEETASFTRLDASAGFVDGGGWLGDESTTDWGRGGSGGPTATRTAVTIDGGDALGREVMTRGGARRICWMTTGEAGAI